MESITAAAAAASKRRAHAVGRDRAVLVAAIKGLEVAPVAAPADV